MSRVARTGILGLLAGVLAVLLTACAGLPVSGPVKIGRNVAEAEVAPDVSYKPNAPKAGMTPQQVVEGFIAAGSGPRDDWGIARQFLSEDFRDEWEPAAAVTVYTPGVRSVSELIDGEVTVDITTEASVDQTGAYTAVHSDPEQLRYRLEQEGGEWRIAEAADGIVLDRNRFSSVFRSYSLMFFDPSWTYLVPDQRWFTVEYARVSIAEKLTTGGPSPWLAESVVTAFTEGTGLAVNAVPVRSQVAEVSLRTAARDLDQTTLDRMQTQLDESLGTAGVADVEMLVDGQPLPATPVDVRSTRVEGRALVLSDGQFGFLSGAEIERLPGLGAALSGLEPDAIEVDVDRRTAAVRTVDGEVFRIRNDGTRQRLDSRPGLVSPTLDPRGYVYAVPTDEPAALTAFGADGSAHAIPDAWPGVTHVYAMRVSRDGTRIAALVRDGVQPSVWVAGIVRDDNGVPVRLGERRVLGLMAGDGIDVTWLDGTRLALLTEVEGQRTVVEQPVGGPSSSTRAPVEASSIAGGNDSGEVRTIDAAGQLYAQRGATWTPLASEIALLAVQQGMPR